MNVLFYREPGSIVNGLDNVAHHLKRSLEKKVHFTFFPRTMGVNYPFKLLNIYSGFLSGHYNAVHFNIAPSLIQARVCTNRWVDGNGLLLKLAKAKGVPTLLNIHGIPAIEGDPSRRQKRLALKTLNDKNACKDVDKVVVNSKDMLSLVIAWYGVDEDKIVVIPNGINYELFSTENKKMILSGNPALLFVGHLCWIKGIDVLLHALVRLKSTLPKMKVHVLGDERGYEGEVDYRLLVEQSELAGQVVFHGVVPHSRIAQYYKSVTICVFPSRHEGCSIALLEAMASGTPVIVSDIESFREILTNGEDAVFFKSGDAVSLSNAILRLSTDAKIGARIAQKASRIAVNFDWNDVADKYVSLYKSLCS